MYFLPAIAWGSTVALGAFALVAIESRDRASLPTLAEVLGCLGMGLVHGLLWLVLLPLTVVLFVVRWLRKK